MSKQDNQCDRRDSEEKKKQKRQKKVCYSDSKTYMGTFRFRPQWQCIPFEILTSELINQVSEKTEVFNSGVLLFESSKKLVVLGRYKETKDLSHFAGGKKKIENLFIAALRELQEESLDTLHLHGDINTCPGILCIDPKRKFCFVLFFGICSETDIIEVQKSFNLKLKEKKSEAEVTSIQGIELNQFINLVKDNRKKVESFGLYEILRKMLEQYNNKIGIEKVFNNLTSKQANELNDCDRAIEQLQNISLNT